MGYLVEFNRARSSGSSISHLGTRPRLLHYSEKKCSRQTKHNATVQRFQGPHHLPTWRQLEIFVTVTRDGIQRIQHGGLVVLHSAKKTVSDCPDSPLETVQNSDGKDRPSHDEDRSSREVPEPSSIAQ